MNNVGRIDVDSIAAIDVHVHIEHSGEESATDRAAKKYFGDSGASHDPQCARPITTAHARLPASCSRWTKP